MYLSRNSLVIAVSLFSAVFVSANPIDTYAEADLQLGGSGSNSIVLVVDWNDGKPKDFISFGIFTDAGTIGDVLMEVELASPQFDFNMIRYSFGPFADAFAFDADRTTEFEPVTDTPYDTGTGTPGEYTHDFSTGYTGINDHLAFNTPAPDFSPWFSSWSGTQGESDWGLTLGLGDSVTDGGAYGFAYGDGSAGPNVIPEPGMITLFLFGIGLFIWLRRHS
jgi:hypothetical protein